MRAAVLGAGNSGLAMAAHLSSCGHAIALWNRTWDNIEELANRGSVRCEGVICGEPGISLVTDEIERAIEGAEIVFVTTPATAHEHIASRLASVVNGEVPVMLNPGRTFGAVRFYDALRKNGCKAIPEIAEAQTIVYTCRKTGPSSVHVYSLKGAVKVSCLVAGMTDGFLSRLPKCLVGCFQPADSILETSLGNVGAMLHCAPLVLNAGWTESEQSTYKYYYDGITPSVGRLVEQMDEERLAVARALGVHVDSVVEWMKREYPTHGQTLFECVRNNDAYREIDAPASLRHRYIYEDVPYGLVQLESLGCQLGVDVHIMTMVVDLACELVGEDFRKTSTVSVKRLRDFL